ncbi:MAG: hypothetical protein K6B68_02075, partial [Eubacterium sp.]|nr:hypothetical protein [Eubacterium sp.]
KVTLLEQHSYFSGYLVEKDGFKVAWAQTASGACNLLDNVIICADMNFGKCVFVGAVGGLTEYSHLDDVKESGAELIEMETSTFYTLKDNM